MIILIVLTVLVVVGILISRYGDYNWGFIGIIMFILSGGFLLILLLTLPTSHLQINGGIAKFETTRRTIAVARENGNELEKATVQNKIIEQNQWLAEQQYGNGTAFDIWIPDEVMELEPLK